MSANLQNHGSAAYKAFAAHRHAVRKERGMGLNDDDQIITACLGEPEFEEAKRMQEVFEYSEDSTFVAYVQNAGRFYSRASDITRDEVEGYFIECDE